jgi:hypothetical protein
MRDEAGTLAPESSDRNKVISSISADFCVKTRFMSQLFCQFLSSISCLLYLFERLVFIVNLHEVIC